MQKADEQNSDNASVYAAFQPLAAYVVLLFADQILHHFYTNLHQFERANLMEKHGNQLSFLAKSIT